MLKLSPILNGFIAYLQGSPTASMTGGQFFRYDSATVNDRIDAQLVPSVKGFAYVVQFESLTNDNPGNVDPRQPVTVSVTVFSVHSGSSSAPLNALESAEVLLDLHGGDFETTDGRTVTVLLSSSAASLVDCEPYLIHSVSFDLKLN